MKGEKAIARIQERLDELKDMQETEEKVQREKNTARNCPAEGN